MYHKWDTVPRHLLWAGSWVIAQARYVTVLMHQSIQWSRVVKGLTWGSRQREVTCPLLWRAGAAGTLAGNPAKGPAM